MWNKLYLTGIVVLTIVLAGLSSIAEILGLEMPDLEGRVLWEALEFNKINC